MLPPPNQVSSTLPMLQAFDELVLMKRGGVLIYAGSLGKFSADMISYFEGIPGKFSPYTSYSHLESDTTHSAKQRQCIM